MESDEGRRASPCRTGVLVGGAVWEDVVDEGGIGIERGRGAVKWGLDRRCTPCRERPLEMLARIGAKCVRRSCRR